MKKIFENINYDIATLFGAGRIKYAPGTLGSLIGLGCVYLLHHIRFVYIAFFMITFIWGIFASDRVQKMLSKKDPKEVIIDEFSCIFVVYLFVPENYMNWPLILSGFILFRVFDIFKIPPVNLFEKLKGGYGIMLDDLVAAGMAGLILRLLILLKIFVKL